MSTIDADALSRLPIVKKICKSIVLTPATNPAIETICLSHDIQFVDSDSEILTDTSKFTDIDCLLEKQVIRSMRMHRMRCSLNLTLIYMKLILSHNLIIQIMVSLNFFASPVHKCKSREFRPLYNRLVDAVHPSSELANIWIDLLSTAIQSNEDKFC